FDRMDQPELEYERLRQDVEYMMDDPKATPGILRNRLKQLDRESLIALLSNNKRISREQAEKAVAKIEEARDTVIRKTEEIERKVTQKLNELKQEALNQAEATRKTAATAAWWFFAAAVISGGASALGGILAFTF
ncbi:MAG: MFS transporter, partial [Bacteroidota bacterium]